jgi:hypothetical protein
MMDYKYIEQLIDRYFEGETSVEEEQILRNFFAQSIVPEHLRQWQPLFQAEQTLASAHLDESFDERILSLTKEYHVQAKLVPLHTRLRPLFRAAAFIAFAVIIGSALERSAGNSPESPQDPVAVNEQDELKADETTPLDIRSAELTDTLKLN